MSRVYDDWERLVFATLDREHLRQLAFASSAETSFNTSTSVSIFPFNFKFHSILHHNPGDSYFITAILLANELVRVSDNTASFKDQCSEVNSKAKRVALLLREAAAASLSHGLYHSPSRHIIGVTENVLKKAISLVHKCRGGIKRVLMAIPESAFHDISFQLECSIANISWLLRDDQYWGVPPIAADEPVLCHIWELNAVLHTGSVEDRCDAVGSLVSFANENEACRQLILAEGHWIQPLLRLLQEGSPEVQENAVMTITLLGKEDSRIIDASVSDVFQRILQQDFRSSKLQGTVASAISELVKAHVSNDIQVFHNRHFIHCLCRLAFKTLQDDKADDYIASTTTRALWYLAKRSWKSCRIIAESVELTRFASFLGSGHEEARYNSAMVLLEVTAEAERDVELRKSVFDTNLPAYKAVVDELIRAVEDRVANSNLLIPCIKAIGNLSNTFTAKQPRIISSLVQLLNLGYNFRPAVSNAVCVTLGKLTNPDNYFHVDHSREIVAAGGANHLVQLVYDGEKVVQTSALILLCYVTINIPERGKLVSADVLRVLEWSAKQTSWIQGMYEYDEKLLGEATRTLDPSSRFSTTCTQRF